MMDTRFERGAHRILVTDDGVTDRPRTDEALAGVGYTDVVVAHGITDPDELADLVERHRPDLVVVAAADAASAAGPLQAVELARRAGEHLPVLVLAPEAASELLDAGAHDVLTEPVSADELDVRVRNLLRVRAQFRELGRQGAIVHTQLTAAQAQATIATDRFEQARKGAEQVALQLDAAREQNLQLTGKLGRSERHNEELIVRLHQIERAYTSLQKRQAEADQRVGALRAELVAGRRQIETLEARTTDAETRFAESEARGIGFLVERDQAREVAAAATVELQQTREVIESLTGQLIETRAQLTQVDRRMDVVSSAEERDKAVRREKAARVQRAIDDGEITMVYQPIMSMLTGRTVGVEALARFSGVPSRGPDEWFADASESGMAVPLEMATVSAALRECANLPDDVFLAVNASPHLLRSPALLAALQGTTRTVVVEMTEHEDVGDYRTLQDAAKAIQATGARLAVDDAGAGFASLEHLVKLSPDIVKLDRELIRGLDTDAVRRSLVGKLVAFGQECGLTVVAEGIENAGELGALRSLGVDFVQGFFLGRPTGLGQALEELPVRGQLFALAGQEAAAAPA